MVLILSETQYIPEDMRKQALLLPVQKSRITVALIIVRRTLMVVFILL